MVTQVPAGGLTSVEQSLVEHVGRGAWLDLIADGEMVDEAAMRSWDESRTCRAAVIRDILRGRLAADPDPHGLRLRGARITGRLDLESLTSDVSLELSDCLLEEGVLARGARLARLGLVGCQIEHLAEPPLDGRGLTCSVFTLTKARVIGQAKTGAVNLSGAHIGGNLDCSGAELRNDGGPALAADGLQVGHHMLMRDEFTATGNGASGTVNLFGAHVDGSLDCHGAKLRNDGGPALVAIGLQVGQHVYLNGQFTAIGCGDLGAVDLVGAHIGGQVECTGARLRNDSGPALAADGLQVGQGIFLNDQFTATGSGDLGAVRLNGAHTSQLICTGAKLRNDSGPALVADGLQVDLATGLDGDFTVTGSSAAGAVRLIGAQIGGQLICTGANLRNDCGPALVADGLQVGYGMVLDDEFTATGSGAAGTVRLVGAHISGELTCAKANLRNDSGPALAAYSLQVGGSLFLARGFNAIGGGKRAAVDLTGARVGGALRFARPQLEHKADSHWRLAVDGLSYPGVPRQISAQDWLNLLRHSTPGYAAQPYQQLAAGYRAAGNERQARKILMAQRDDELARTQTRWPERLWGKITKITLGYGYQPWRALLFLAAVVAISCVLAVALGSHGALTQTSKTTTPGRSCTVVQQVSVGLDLNLPVGTSVARVDCDVTTDSASVTAAWLTVVGWVLRLLAWVFAALFIAGFTSAVRKT